MHSRQRIQAKQYDFPYHHLVDMDEVSFTRSIEFGLDYFTYMRRVLELVRKYATDHVLDIGCGDGYLLCQIGQDDAMAARICGVGIDVDERAIAFARAFSYGMPGIHFEACDARVYQGASDLITLVETLEHIPDDALPSFLRDVDRILRPGGVVIVSVPSNVRPVLSKHFRHYDLQTLDDHFGNYRLLEVFYVTARNSLLYQAVARLLARRRGFFRTGPVRDLLLRTHFQFTGEVSERRGAHIVAVYRKPVEENPDSATPEARSARSTT